MYGHKVRGRGRGFSKRNNEVSNSAYHMKKQLPKQTNMNISKHDNNCCRAITISLDLGETEENFFKELKSMWSIIKNSPQVISKLHHFFNTCSNPYVETLRLLYNCQDFFNAKSKSLPHFIMEEFKNWSAVSRNKIIHLLTPDIKVDAFKVVSKQNATLLKKLVMECYEFNESKSIFHDIIKCMIDKKNYREACQFASLLNMHEEFTIDQFLVPLVLQDKLFVVDEFLEGSPKHQTELVLWLDSILGLPSVNHAIMDYVLTHEINDVKFDKLHGKPWKKLITRFMKMYKLPSDLTPNLVKKRSEGALQFILQKRFVDRAFSDDSYREMVQEAVGNDEELQKELVYQVSMYNDQPEAQWWANHYNIDREHWPYNLRSFADNKHYKEQVLGFNMDDEWAEVQPEIVYYHKFPLAFDCIHLIDSEEKFRTFLASGLQGVDVVGMDCEWKPSFCSQASELALMQIATRKFVFILDIINLGNKVPHLWQELGKFLFNNCDILKLGFNFSGDITMIKQALPELNFNPKQVGFLDLGSLWKQLDRFPKVHLPYEVKSGGSSLTTLVEHCVGKPLDKSDQLSNWEKRPLRDSQLLYAALDSYCLIEVYDILRRCCEEHKLHFDEICYNLMTNEKMHKKKPKKAIGKRRPNPNYNRNQNEQVPSPHTIPRTPDQIKIVCDTMLQGLAKNLRRVGINATALENHQDHMECVRQAIDDQRYILTRGSVFDQLNGCVPKGHCLQIPSNNVDEQLKYVLEYFNIQVSKDFIFSRCQSCNGNSFIKVSRSTMMDLVASCRSRQVGPPCYFEDEATGFSSEEEEPYYNRPAVSNTRKWDLCPDEKLDVGLCQTRLGAAIQVLSVPPGVITKNELFYVCEECGKVYWDGTHFDKVVEGRLKGIVQ